MQVVKKGRLIAFYYKYCGARALIPVVQKGRLVVFYLWPLYSNCQTVKLSNWYLETVDEQSDTITVAL